MARVCTVCTHTHRAAIETLMLDGASSRDVARTYPDVMWASIERHCANHVALAVRQAAEVVTGEAMQMTEPTRAKGGSILEKLWETEDLLAWGMGRAKEKRALIQLATLGAQRRATLETLAKLYTQLSHPPEEIDAAREQEWARFQMLVTTALREFPEARARLGEAILMIERRRADDVAREDDNGDEDDDSDEDE